MATRFVHCRNTVTGATADLPETALKHLAAYVPVDPADRERLGYPANAGGEDQSGSGEAEQGRSPAGPDTPSTSGAPAADGPQTRTKHKPATGEAKTPKGSNDGH